MKALKYKRVLLKMSGEILKGKAESGIVPEATLAAAKQIQAVVNLGAEVALVIGAGNLFRGQSGSREGMDRCCADQMGMLATIMNALAMRDALESLGLEAEILSAVGIPGMVEKFNYREADRLLRKGVVTLFAAGTGHPFFTTDTTAALRACEIQADAVLKGTKVDGVYSADPVKDPDAKRYETVTFGEALAKQLKVMDSTAFSLCMDNDLPIIVFNFNQPGVLSEVLCGDLRAATIVTNA